MSSKKAIYNLVILLVCLFLFSAQSLAIDTAESIVSKSDLSIQLHEARFEHPNFKPNAIQLQKVDFNKSSNALQLNTLPPTTLTWGLLYGTNGICYNQMSIIRTADNGYFIGNSILIGTSNNIYLVKTNASGTELWERLYSSSGVNFATTAVQQTSDGGYIVAGYFSSGSTGGDFLLKVDSLGNMQWFRTYSGYYLGTPTVDVTQYTDGGYVVVSHMLPANSIFYRVRVFRTNATGTILWDRDYSSAQLDIGKKVLVERGTGNLIVLSQGKNFLEGTSIIGLYKLNAAGTVLTSRAYTISGDCTAADIKQTQDNYFAVLGNSSVVTQDGITQRSVLLLKFDSLFQDIWSRTYPVANSTLLNSTYLEETSDGGFVITSEVSFSVSSPIPPNALNILLIETDALGSQYWIQQYDLGVGEIPVYVHRTEDMGYVIGGLFWSDSNSFIFLIKLI